MFAVAPGGTRDSLDDIIMNFVAFMITWSAFLDAGARDFVELQGDDARIRREVQSMVVEPTDRRPAKRRRARYADRLDQLGTPCHGNAKWFRDWRHSAYSQYLSLHPAAVYVAEPLNDATLRAEFTQKIRLPLRVFQELRDEMQRDPFMRERETACPLENKLIAALRYLAVGAGWGALRTP